MQEAEYMDLYKAGVDAGDGNASGPEDAGFRASTAVLVSTPDKWVKHPAVKAFKKRYRYVKGPEVQGISTWVVKFKGGEEEEMEDMLRQLREGTGDVLDISPLMGLAAHYFFSPSRPGATIVFDMEGWEPACLYAVLGPVAAYAYDSKTVFVQLPDGVTIDMVAKKLVEGNTVYGKAGKAPVFKACMTSWADEVHLLIDRTQHPLLPNGNQGFIYLKLVGGMQSDGAVDKARRIMGVTEVGAYFMVYDQTGQQYMRLLVTEPGHFRNRDCGNPSITLYEPKLSDRFSLLVPGETEDAPGTSHTNEG